MIRLRRPARSSAPFLVLALAAGCTGPEAEKPADDAQPLPRWSAVEELRVGSVDDPARAFTWFRQMEVGPDGRMYTLHPQEQVVRVFSPDGTPEGTLAGRGEGPGELENAYVMGWVADTLWIMDGGGPTLARFSSDGTFLGGTTIPIDMGEDPSDSPPRPVGLLHDGTIYGAIPAWSNLVASGEITHHRQRLMAADGSVTDTLPAIAFGNSSWAVYDPDSPNSGGSYGRQPFGDGPLFDFAAGERALIVVDRTAPTSAADATWSIHKLAFSGDTLWTREHPFDPVALQEAEVDSVLDARAGPIGERSVPGATAATAREWAAATLHTPDFKPHVTSLVVGRDGTLWLATAVRSDSTVWLVANEAGEPEAEVVLPPELTVLEAERGTVWGIARDDLDVPYLMRYAVRGDGG